MKFKGIHHVAIICSNYQKSKTFYTEILGFEVIRETYRAERQSYKLDLQVNPYTIIELFSFPNPPVRVTAPEACGLRHLAFSVTSVEDVIQYLYRWNILTEPIRVDSLTGKKYTFFRDPDELPIEIYEM